MPRKASKRSAAHAAAISRALKRHHREKAARASPKPVATFTGIGTPLDVFQGSPAKVRTMADMLLANKAYRPTAVNTVLDPRGRKVVSVVLEPRAGLTPERRTYGRRFAAR